MCARRATLRMPAFEGERRMGEGFKIDEAERDSRVSWTREAGASSTWKKGRVAGLKWCVS